MLNKSFQVVFDTGTKHFLNNKIFLAEYADRFPGASVWPLIYDYAQTRGWEMMTGDIFLKHRSHVSCTALCISEMITPSTFQIISKGAIPLIIFCAESPNVAWPFYRRVSSYVRLFQHAFLFSGVRKYISKPTYFHPFHWPNTQRHQTTGLNWADRQYLVMISSNKQRFSVSEHLPFKLVQRFAKQLLWYYLSRSHPLLSFTDLYHLRLDAISYFSNIHGFKLFGHGWDAPRGMSKYHWDIINSIRPLPVESKLDILKGFRFALCFENCIFPGYITEKIFDCFFAGCIPVYLGAPNISDFIPESTFIDMRKFKNWNELDSHLCGLSEREYYFYQLNIKSFLASHSYDLFHQDFFASSMLTIIEHV